MRVYMEDFMDEDDLNAACKLICNNNTTTATTSLNLYAKLSEYYANKRVLFNLTAH